MNSIPVGLLCFLFLFSGCQYVQTQNNGAADVETVTTSDDCRSDNWFAFCTDIKGQIFYTKEELLAAPIRNGDIRFQYHLEDFRIFLVGGNHAYTAFTDSDGNFGFSNIVPGYYTLIAKLTPVHGSEVFYDCDKWDYSAQRCLNRDTEGYRIGIVRSGISIRSGEKLLMNSTNIQKLYVDTNGWLDETQDVMPENNAHRERYLGPDLKLSN